MNIWISYFIQLLQSLPTEVLGILTYVTALGSIWILHRIFGKEALFLFVVLAVILANIQSLKAINLSFLPYPIAMGTVLFSLSLLATDILAEFYGQKTAEKAIWLGFAGMILVCIFMLFAVGAKVTITHPEAIFYHYLEAHTAMTVIFTPAPALFLASLLAYLLSQYTDMVVFLWLKQYTKERFLGLRTCLATMVAAFIDNCVFSILAWKILYPISLDFKTFIFTYIIGIFVLRMIISIANVPFMYLIRHQNRISVNVPNLS